MRKLLENSLSNLPSKNKVAELCAVLRKETLEPAEQQAKEIIENAYTEKERILQKARLEIKDLQTKAEKEMEKKQKSFSASMQIAMDRSIDMLKQAIESHLFSSSLGDLFQKELEDSKLVAKLVDGIAKGLEKEGIDSDLELIVSESLNKKELLSALMTKMKNRIEVKQEPLLEGIELKVKDQHFAIDFTKKALEDLLSRFIRQDFRETLFQKSS